MINEKLLDEAILEVAKERIGQELRNAVIYGSPEMSKVYALYLNKVDEKKAARGELRFQLIAWTAVCVGVVAVVKALS